MRRRKAKSVERATPDFVTEQIERLKEFFPECVAEGKVDFERLKETLGQIVEDGPERYSFTWAGKRDAFRLLQVPSRGTLKPCPEESVDWETTRNVFIEGENLEVLKLLYKSYAGRVKMIYIDPPYNTGNDFIYRDNFADPLDTYLKLTGQKDAEGNLLTSNPETSGRYHSAWLCMMYPRLFVARQLLREDGIIFVSCDDHEVHNLRMLLNEIFGEENFVEEIIWKNKYGSGALTKGFANVHEYTLCYTRGQLSNLSAPLSEKEIKKYKDRDSKAAKRGGFITQPLATTSKDDRPNLRYPIVWKGKDIWPEKQWIWERDRLERALENDELVIRETNGKYSVRVKQYLRDEKGRVRHAKPISILNGPFNQEGTDEIRHLFGKKVFDFPKPSSLIRYFFSFSSNDDEPNEGIFMDFFAGSCPAAQAVLALNRQDGGSRRFVVVQFPEPTPKDSVASEEGYKTIAEIGKERIRRVIKKLEKEAKKQQGLFKDRETPEDLGLRVFRLVRSNYRLWRGLGERDGEKYAEEMELFTDPLLPGWKAENVIWEVAIKEGYGLSSTVEKLKDIKGNRVWRVTDPDRRQSFLVCLDDKLKAQTIRALKLTKEDLFVCRDSGLTDEQVANVALTCKLKTI